MMQSLTLLMLLGFIWGSGYTIARYAVTHGVSPLGYSFWQSLGPAMVLLLLTSKTWSKQLRYLFRFWRYYAITGVLGIAIPNTNMYFSAPHLPAGLVAVMVNTVPLMVYPLALLTGQERFKLWRLLGVLIGVVGIMMIIVHGANLSGGPVNHWLLTTLITPLSFALCAIYINKYRPPAVDNLVLSAAMLTASTLLLAPLVHYKSAFYPLQWPLTTVDGILLLEIVLSSVGYVLFFQLIKIAGPVYYSFVSAIVCLTGLFWGAVFFSEQISIIEATAVLLILIAITLVTWQYRANINLTVSSTSKLQRFQTGK